jgi:23S rRNA U2552 (ribose-2'-O)-methylase RlmE/FtsJ
MSSSSSAPVVSDINDNGFVFRTVVSDAFQGKVMAALAQKMGFTKVHVVRPKATREHSCECYVVGTGFK